MSADDKENDFIENHIVIYANPLTDVRISPFGRYSAKLSKASQASLNSATFRLFTGGLFNSNVAMLVFSFIDRFIKLFVDFNLRVNDDKLYAIRILDFDVKCCHILSE